MNKHCFGCIAYHEVYEFEKDVECSFQFSNIDGLCPCTNCIVKVICNQICDPFVDYCDKGEDKYA